MGLVWIAPSMVTGREVFPCLHLSRPDGGLIDENHDRPGGSRLRHWAGERLSPDQEIDGHNLLLRIGCTPGTGVQMVRQLAMPETRVRSFARSWAPTTSST